MSDSFRPFLELSSLSSARASWKASLPLLSEIFPPQAYSSKRGALAALRISQILLQDGLPSDQAEKVRRICVTCNVVLSTLEYLQNRGFPVCLSEHISQQFTQGWASLFQVVSVHDEAYYWQNPATTIQGLKVYGDESGQKWADIALKTLGQGSYKLAKEVLRITDIGVRVLVRYTPKHEPERAVQRGWGLPTIEVFYQERFLREMRGELEARAFLQHGGKIPGVLEIFVQKYLNSRYTIKTRFFSEKCDYSLNDLVYDARGKFRPLDHQQKQTLFHFCCTMLDTLGQLHARGVVHRDIKLDNIFILGNKVFLADFGFWGRIGDEAYVIGERGKKHRRGTPSYMPPEVAYATAPRNDPSMDMYSCGIMLLRIYDQPLSRQHDVIALKTHRSCIQDREYTQDCREKDIVVLRKTLRERNDGIGTLISDLIDTNPMNRPSAQHTYDRLKAYLR